MMPSEEERAQALKLAVEELATESDNGMTKEACDDVANEMSDEEAAAKVKALSHDEQLRNLEIVVTRSPLNREIMYKILAEAKEELQLQELERRIAEYPQFAHCLQNQYHMIITLTQANGLELIERDIDGNVVLPEMKEGLSEDGVDDLVETLNFKTTPLGLEFVEIHSPRARLIEMMNLNPERKDTYIEVLEYVKGTSRSYNEIKSLLDGRPVLQTIFEGRPETMQPSVFVDKLERNGALVWKDGWTLTQEGMAFLEEMKALG